MSVEAFEGWDSWAVLRHGMSVLGADCEVDLGSSPQNDVRLCLSCRKGLWAFNNIIIIIIIATGTFFQSSQRSMAFASEGRRWMDGWLVIRIVYYFLCVCVRESLFKTSLFTLSSQSFFSL